MTERNAADLARLGIGEAADLMRRKELSPVELTEACLARIDRLNPILNCFITVTAERALLQAREAELEMRRGTCRGPLHGIPIALKDLFDTAGVRTTAASAVYKDRVPTEDAEVVRRLNDAGAVILGKTNMVEFAYGTNSAVSHFGPVNNPWNLAANTGGSSGGSAAAVAAGLCLGALGSDTAGSIRIPGAICGVVGLKPTYGLVSTRGAIPLSWSLDHVGPITRSVVDSARMLQVIAGYDASDPTSTRFSVPDYSADLTRPPAAVRIGVPRGFFFENLHPEVEAAMAVALAVLGHMTAGLQDVVLPLRAEEQEPLRSAVRSPEAYAYHYAAASKSPELFQAETRARILGGSDISARTYIQARRELEQARRVFERAFDTIDVLVTPTMQAPPTTTAEMNEDRESSIRIGGMYIRNTAPFNVWGNPTLTVPCGFTRSGLPLGLQITGRNGDEALILRLAQAYEAATEWHKREPQGMYQSS